METTAPTTLLGLKPGDHLCCLYETEEEHRAVLAPFLRHGLEHGEKLVYVAEDHTREQVLAYLESDGCPVAALLTRGQLVVVSPAETYLRGGAFDPDDMIEFLRSETERALGEGYSALRVTGEMSWALRAPPGSERLIEYEAKLNRFFPDSKCLAICQYDRRRFDAGTLLEVLCTHPIAAIGTNLYNNFYYIPPDDFLGPNLDEAALRDRIANLAAQRQAEEDLRRSRDEWQSTFDALSDGISIHDPAYNIIQRNAAFERLVPNSGGEAKCYKLVHGLDAPLPHCPMTKALASKQSESHEFFEPWIDRHLSIRIDPILDKAGNALRLVHVVSDISSRTRAEETVRDLQTRLQLAIRASNIGLWDWDLRNNEVYFSPEWKAQIGYADSELPNLYEEWESRLHPDDRERTLEKAKAAQASPSSEYRVEFRLRHKDGSYRWILARGQVVCAGEGKPYRMLGSHSDITDRKRGEAELELLVRQRTAEVTEQRAYNRSLIEASLDPLVTISPQGKITDVNEATITATGVPREELIGTDFCDYFTEPERAKQGYQHVFSEGLVTDYPLTIRHVDGRLTDVLYNASVYKDSKGNVVGVFAAARNISAQKQAWQYARSLLEASLDPLVTISPQGTITDVNEATVKVTGVLREQLIGTDFSDYFTEPERAREGYRHVFSEGFVIDYPLTIRHASGQLTDVLYNASVYRDARGKVLGVFAAARDITERKKAEEEIRRLNSQLEQRVETRTAELAAANNELEAFVYAVAHDLRAPLRHIDGFSRLLLDEQGKQVNAQGRHYLEMIRTGTQRMGRLLEDLLNLSRVGRQQLQWQVCGLNSLLEEVLNESKPDLKDRRIEWRIARLPFVECDPGLMKQVFTNLLSNAVKFSRPRDAAIIEVGQTVVDGHRAMFVRDNGVGFNMKYADKLFGVFQRLHRQEDFEGTGVGLATVQRIVNKHHGRVWARAELDVGATFYFTLGKTEQKSTSSTDKGVLQ